MRSVYRQPAKNSMPSTAHTPIHSPPGTYAQTILNKVPQVTLAFWIIKILSTTVGETGADYLAVSAGLGKAVTGAIMASLLLTALFLQVKAKQYTPWIYWITMVLLSVVGTQITDALTDGLGISLKISTVVFTVVLALVFAVWYRSEGTLSIHAITTRRRELFYWAAILFTFALGTASGDLATEALGLGFRLGAIIFAAMIAFIYIAFRLGLNPVLAFWLAYILTRPLGAALGDFLSQAKQYGGLGWGTIGTSVVFLAVIALLVTIVTLQQRRSEVAKVALQA